MWVNTSLYVQTRVLYPGRLDYCLFFFLTSSWRIFHQSFNASKMDIESRVNELTVCLFRYSKRLTEMWCLTGLQLPSMRESTSLQKKLPEWWISTVVSLEFISQGFTHADVHINIWKKRNFLIMQHARKEMLYYQCVCPCKCHYRWTKNTHG